MSIDAIMDTDADEKRRRRVPIDLAYVVLSGPKKREIPQQLIIDQNDSTGARMQLLFPHRNLRHRDGYTGFAALNSMEIGIVTTNTNPFFLDAAKAKGQPVLSLVKR